MLRFGTDIYVQMCAFFEEGVNPGTPQFQTFVAHLAGEVYRATHRDEDGTNVTNFSHTQLITVGMHVGIALNMAKNLAEFVKNINQFLVTDPGLKTNSDVYADKPD